MIGNVGEKNDKVCLKETYDVLSPFSHLNFQFGSIWIVIAMLWSEFIPGSDLEQEKKTEILVGKARPYVEVPLQICDVIVQKDH